MSSRLTIKDEVAIFAAAAPFQAMRFTLTYDGPLPSDGSPKQKWVIRNQLHPQLELLWRTDPVLTKLDIESIVPKEGASFQVLRWGTPNTKKRTPTDQELDLCAPIMLGDRRMFPLVRNSLHLACALDILYLREEKPSNDDFGLLTSSGDIDNRLKTLFDALQMGTPDDVHGDSVQHYPLFCLLENDKLIYKVAVRGGRLLTPIPLNSQGRPTKNYVRLVIDVSVIVTRVNPANVILLGS